MMDSLAIWLGTVAAVAVIVRFILETCGLRRYVREKRKQRAIQKAWDSYWIWYKENGGPFIRF